MDDGYLIHESRDYLQECLKQILDIEGWDQTTFTMPQALRKKPTRAL